ncbi:ABC transporter ATP-binding protein [Streptomyces qinglanensis]|uniref:Putative ABC transport system ATP-binding protein n=1 Tax=Streptomyces qinglanensis TaxID=943816 RepID=A0A1H9PTM8_9ACTN|nr:putative ABC transport system ATP-binding protein [Streptomyces qinglanensis]
MMNVDDETYRRAGSAAAGGPPAALALTGVTRRYGRRGAAVEALRGIEVELPRGSFTAVMGPSGSGKSTLLQCAVGLDRPTAGSVRLGGQELTGMGRRALTRLRRERIGFVFQSFNLLPALTAEQNVGLPLRLAGTGSRRARTLAREALGRVGLAERAGRRPAELSGGQQQRVALARALVTAPEIVCADEPTGALDPATAEEMLGLLRGAVDMLGATVLMVTHDPAAAAHADRVLFLADGMLVDTYVCAGSADGADGAGDRSGDARTGAAAHIARRMRALAGRTRSGAGPRSGPGPGSGPGSGPESVGGAGSVPPADGGRAAAGRAA